jgi:hypothetical protein
MFPQKGKNAKSSQKEPRRMTGAHLAVTSSAHFGI